MNLSITGLVFGLLVEGLFHLNFKLTFSPIGKSVKSNAEIFSILPVFKSWNNTYPSQK